MPLRLLHAPTWLAPWATTLLGGQVLAVLSPATVSDYIQAVNLALMLLGTTVLTLWQRRHRALREEWIRDDAARHQSVQDRLEQVSGQLAEACHDRETLWLQVAEIAARMAKLACPFAEDDTALCRQAGGERQDVVAP